MVLHGSCLPLLPELMVHFGTGCVTLKRFFPPVLQFILFFFFLCIFYDVSNKVGGGFE